MQRMPAGPHDADKRATSDNQAVKKVFGFFVEQSIVDDLPVSFADSEALQCG